MKLLLFIGTRPEIIKMSPLICALKKQHKFLETTVVFTGQHKDSIKNLSSLFNLKIDIYLDVMVHNQSLAELTGKLLHQIDQVAKELQPDWILAQGDTTSVFVASLVAFYRKIKFAHVEAGLRTYNKHSPFPEEFNRKICGIIADIHFVPTQTAKENLLKENITPEQILLTGNTGIDALKTLAMSDRKLPFSIPEDKKIVLATVHRRENFSNLDNIFNAFADIANLYPDVQIIYPVHMNSQIEEKARKILSGFENVLLLSALSYECFVQLMKISKIILTDSGGVQEEAPSFGVPILVLRDTTERPEGVLAGVSHLIGSRRKDIVKVFGQFYQKGFPKHSKPNPYGDGFASEKIAKFFLELLHSKNYKQTSKQINDKTREIS